MMMEDDLRQEGEDRMGQRLSRARKRVYDRYRDQSRKARRYRGRKGRSDDSLPMWLQEKNLAPLRAELRAMDVAHSRMVRKDRLNGQSGKALKPIARTALSPGTIADAWVPFEDGTDYKRRPVAVSKVDSRGVHVYPITTSMRRFNRIDKLIEISDVEGAGLKRSCGIIGREVVLPRTDLISRVGSLQGPDAEKFKIGMRRHDGIQCAQLVAQGHTAPAAAA